MHQIRTLQLEILKTADFHLNLLESWELVTGYYEMRAFWLERPLPGMVILWLYSSMFLIPETQ